LLIIIFANVSQEEMGDKVDKILKGMEGRSSATGGTISEI
jgi:hypothetical protein